MFSAPGCRKATFESLSEPACPCNIRVGDFQCQAKEGFSFWRRFFVEHRFGAGGYEFAAGDHEPSRPRWQFIPGIVRGLGGE